MTRLERFVINHVPARYHWWLGTKHEQVRYFASRWLNVQFIRGYLAGKFGR
jgi:hypothetical protein